MKVKFYESDGTCKEERDYAIPELDGCKGVQVLKEVILGYRANLRQGDACTKTRGDVNGSGKKPFRQKGNGRARQGEKRSPLMRGGGVVFGPKPRDFTVCMNRKEKQLALKRALFEVADQKKLLVLKELKEMKAPKTAVMATLFDEMVPQGRGLILDDAFSRNQLLSIRNLERFDSMEAGSVNAFDLMRYPYVVITERALGTLFKRLEEKK
jgi:large subunit ribosomal protein L4